MIVKIISGFITGLVLGFILSYPTTLVLDKFLPISEEWFPGLAGLVILFIVVPFIYGVLGALFIATIDIPKPFFRFLRYGFIILIVIVNLYGFSQLGLFNIISSFVPGFGADTIPTSKATLEATQKDMDFIILAPSRLPEGVTKDFGKGVFDVYIDEKSKKCNSISFNYRFAGELIFVAESKADVSTYDCENYMLVSKESYEELSSKILQKDPYAEELDLGETNILISRYKGERLDGKLEKALFIKYGTIVKVNHGDPMDCEALCESTIFNFLRSMEQVILEKR